MGLMHPEWRILLYSDPHSEVSGFSAAANLNLGKSCVADSHTL
jgi:hypothetical protein